MFPTTAKQINSFSEIKYLEGLPREYRFNAKTGTLSQGGNLDVTKKGEPFSILPIAYRIFSADMFNYEGKDWAEIFFINERGHMSCMMVHGFSVDALRQCMADLFYEDVNLCQTVLTVTPVQKSNEFGTYYVAQFKATPLPERERDTAKMLHDSLARPIFQYKTVSVNASNSTSMNMPILRNPEDRPELYEGEEDE